MTTITIATRRTALCWALVTPFLGACSEPTPATEASPVDTAAPVSTDSGTDTAVVPDTHGPFDTTSGDSGAKGSDAAPTDTAPMTDTASETATDTLLPPSDAPPDADTQTADSGDSAPADDTGTEGSDAALTDTASETATDTLRPPSDAPPDSDTQTADSGDSTPADDTGTEGSDAAPTDTADTGTADTSQGDTAAVWVYSGPKRYRSPKYEVTVRQGGRVYDSFVYLDTNQHDANRDQMTDTNHFTVFSFSGTVTVAVRKRDGDIGSCTVHPLPKHIACTVRGDTAEFTLSQPEKLWIELHGEYENPLFVFADPPETDVPSPSAPNVVYFGPGIHDVGKHYKLHADTTYYLAGGAYVRGSLLSDPNADNITVRGRGVLSGENIAPCGYSSCRFDRVAVRFDGSRATNLVVEGITIVKPGMYCIQAYGGKLHTDNVKAFGWWFETDGWVGGDGSVLENSFFKVYDDVVKLYFDGQQVRNLVVYKQHNGAVFQLGWGGEDGRNAVVRNIYVVNDETNWNQSGLEGNRAFLNTANGNSGNTVRHIDIRNVYYDKDVSYVVGIKTQGDYRDIAITNMRVRGKQKYKSYLAGGTIDGVAFTNVRIGGACVGRAADIALATAGSVSNVTFSCP